jgi:hypothetical protein
MGNTPNGHLDFRDFHTMALPDGQLKSKFHQMLNFNYIDFKQNRRRAKCLPSLRSAIAYSSP